jgi:cell pole-organizing protein PopZ
MNAPSSNSGERDFDAVRRAQRTNEPSMEEILASIRAIIADDREPSAPKPQPAPKPAAPVGPQIVYSNDSPQVAKPLIDAVALAPRVEAIPEPAAPNVVWARPREPISPPLPEPTREPEPEPQVAQSNEPPLLSDETDRAVAASFEALTQSVAQQSAELVDRLTREMLRPMVKTWLDEHLPNMVERFVRAEIQRVARGSR